MTTRRTASGRPAAGEPYLPPAYRAHLAEERRRQRVGMPVYRSFDAYAADYPEAESARAWITGGQPRATWLFQGDGTHGNLPGDHLVAQLIHRTDMPHCIYVHDSDDGVMVKGFASDAEAIAAIEEIVALAPVSFQDLADAFGFRGE